MVSANAKAIQRINQVMLLNLLCLLLHLLLYSDVPELLLAKQNPFGELVVVMAGVALIGIWLCMDYILPVYVEAKVAKEKVVSRPTGWLVSLNLLAIMGGGYWAATGQITIV